MKISRRTTEALATLDVTDRAADFIVRLDQPIAQALVIPFLMAVLDN